ncbi:MAG: LacI family DNA-binding transcriptional regulator [Acidimicrobiia bacterium]
MVTIREVASEAGVSVATVSRALRGLPSVAPATRDRVLEVADRLRYVPDPYAARLASTRAHTIIVAVPLPGQWYYAQVVAGVEAVASEAGMDLQLHVVGDDVQRRHFVEDVLPHQRRIDGAILVDIPLDNDDVMKLLDRGTTLVGVGQHIEGIVTIGIDNRRAAQEATTHLISCGRRRIGLLGGMPEGWTRLSIPGEREAGYREALVEAGLEIDETIIVSGNFSVAGGFDATSELLPSATPPDGLFALSDEMAAGAIQAARRVDVGVPDDLAIVGFDDHEFSEAMGLTTVRQPVAELGELAAQALLDAVEGTPWQEDRVLAHHLVVRATSCPR